MGFRGLRVACQDPAIAVLGLVDPPFFVGGDRRP